MHAGVGFPRRQLRLSHPCAHIHSSLIKLLVAQTTHGWNWFGFVVGDTWSEQTFVHVSLGNVGRDQVRIHNPGQPAVSALLFLICQSRQAVLTYLMIQTRSSLVGLSLTWPQGEKVRQEWTQTSWQPRSCKGQKQRVAVHYLQLGQVHGWQAALVMSQKHPGWERGFPCLTQHEQYTSKVGTLTPPWNFTLMNGIYTDICRAIEGNPRSHYTHVFIRQKLIHSKDLKMH